MCSNHHWLTGSTGVLVLAHDHQVVVAGVVGVLEHHDGVARVVEVPHRGAGQLGVDGEAVQGGARLGAGDDGPAGGDDRVGVAQILEHEGALGQVPAGADGDEDAGGAGVIDRPAAGVGDGAIGVEEGAVEVDGDHVVVGHERGYGAGMGAATSTSTAQSRMS